MNDHHTTFGGKVILFINWLAAALGIGTLADVVPVVVGLLSAAWICVQLFGYFRYELPLKRARLAAARRGDLDLCETDRGGLER